jgi:RNA-directed DNA polymerase
LEATPSPFAIAFQFRRVPRKAVAYRQTRQAAQITSCVRGVISPALANCALDGLERLLKEKFPPRRPFPSLGGKLPCVNFIRYADDFIITGRTKELLEGEIRPLVEQFLQKRGLELSPTKTVITHVEQGFDFLGQNVRKYPKGKLLIKPSKKNVKVFLDGIRKIIKAALGMSAAELIDWLNPKIRGCHVRF